MLPQYLTRPAHRTSPVRLLDPRRPCGRLLESSRG